MICPKCQNVMRTVSKNNVHIEQCDGCRGIFLDRGELEQLVGAESAYYGSAPPPYRGDSPRPYHGDHRPHGGSHYYPDSPRPHYTDSPKPYRGKRKRGFLEELFD
ncbi:TFIIB-type zinc ribbon-containing protein [Amycolatopsis pigmentata]|uniref:Zf-TFIIB domain-containing protein n=1 Tax=Amycolatopsis pigmentata TaxID=450801 RepID=A0ABW5G296_9PSEU